MDERLPYFIQEIIEKAKISKGSKIYEHGLSLRRASELLGISQWQLMHYVGKTRIADTEAPPRISTKDRLRYAKSIFGL